MEHFNFNGDNGLANHIKEYITNNFGVYDFGEDDSIADLIKDCIEGLLKTYGFLDDERNATIFMEYPQFKNELNESLDWAFKEYLNITDWAEYLSLNA